MPCSRPGWTAIALFALCSCGHTSGVAPTGGDDLTMKAPPDAAVLPDLTTSVDFAMACAITESSSLAGVNLRIMGDCRFTLAQAAAGISIPYVLSVDADVPEVLASLPDPSPCTTPGPSGLMIFEQLAGGGQNYCLCDQGLCAGHPAQAFTLKKGSYPASFQWDGRNWYGPSDTNNPKGPAFPPGTYQLVITAGGLAGAAMTAFSLRATLDLVLVP